LAQVDVDAPISARVQDAIARELPSGPPTMVQIAKRLGVSERTLRRALEEESTSFRVMVEGVRRGRAEQLLAQRRTSIGEIAFLLGFSDASAFSRAFRRWSGKTPKEFRETH
jgi:AraC-like DNA-binding protein